MIEMWLIFSDVPRVWGGIFRYYMLLSIYTDTIHYMVHIIDCTVYIHICLLDVVYI